MCLILSLTLLHLKCLLEIIEYMEEDIYSPKVDYSPGQSTEEQKTIFQKMGASLVDFIQTLVVFGAIFAIIYLFVAQPHKVSGSSMVPTFINGDFILTDKISYRLGEPKNGDIIVLKNPRNESQDFIKRIIALPGQTLKVEGSHVFVDGNEIPETYLPSEIVTRSGAFLHEGQSILVSPDEYFVFGDNRNHSSDSREWGPITKAEIVGKVFFRYWPVSSFGLIHHSSS